MLWWETALGLGAVTGDWLYSERSIGKRETVLLWCVTENCTEGGGLVRRNGIWIGDGVTCGCLHSIFKILIPYKDFQWVSGIFLVMLQPFLGFISFVISMCHNLLSELPYCSNMNNLFFFISWKFKKLSNPPPSHTLLFLSPQFYHMSWISGFKELYTEPNYVI